MKRVALAAVPIVLVAVLALVFTRGERGSAVARNEPAPAPEEREEAVLVDPGEVAPSGLAERPEKRREVETPAPAETPPAPVAEPPPTATAIGRLVDEATGEPVPFQEIDFNLSRDDTERLVTDEHGNFESSHTHPTGTVRIDLRRLRTGGWMQPIRVEHDVDDRRRVDVPVRIGPTYRLDLEVPAGVELTDLMVSLDAAHPVEDVLGSRAREAEVRAGDLPWVRFQKPLLYEEPAPPWELAVAAKGTAWRGTAPVDSITGIYPELVRIVLMKSAELGGRLASARAESV